MSDWSTMMRVNGKRYHCLFIDRPWRMNGQVFAGNRLIASFTVGSVDAAEQQLRRLAQTVVEDAHGVVLPDWWIDGVVRA